MTFEDDAGIDGVNFNNGSIADICGEGIEEDVEMIPACRSSIDVVVGSNAIKVTHIWLHSLQQLEGLLLRYWWNWRTNFTKFKNV